jgi:SEC-C motif
MGKRRRDRAGICCSPWKESDLCPCGSNKPFGLCCLGIDGSPRKTIVNYNPPGCRTGHSHPDCYLNWTRNCSEKLSREHFISGAVLKLINPTALRISGTSWIPQGETRDLSLNALQAKVLCDRHNSAFSPLDEMAGRFFGTLAAYYDDLSRRSLSSKGNWFTMGPMTSQYG